MQESLPVQQEEDEILSACDAGDKPFKTKELSKQMGISPVMVHLDGMEVKKDK